MNTASETAPMPARAEMGRALIAFGRPHTLIGTTVSATALLALAVQAQGVALSANLLWILAGALAACLGANVYIVGLNQLFDVDIDRINKPYLPLASGALNRAQGWAIVLAALALVFAVALSQGSWLLGTVGVSVVVGTLYSVPPIRLKRIPAAAALCILLVRGPVANLGLFLHFRQSIGGPAELTAEVLGLTAFMVLFGTVIAICKDIPDTDGDREFHVFTYAVRFGRQAVFRVSQIVLIGAYLALAAAAAIWMTRVNLLVLGTYGVVAASWVLIQGRNLTSGMPEPKLRMGYRRYYLLIWRLFYLQYLVFPLACLPKSW